MKTIVKLRLVPAVNPYPTMSPAAARRVLVAVIRQAVEDYRAYEKRGLIVQGRAQRPSRRRPFVERDECRRLVKFFRCGGALDQLITIGRLEVNGDAIRERLGMNPTPE